MLSKPLAIFLIFLTLFSVFVLIGLPRVYEISTVSLILTTLILHLIIIVLFVLDISKNQRMPNKWVWMVLIFLAPVIIMIAYTVTYVPSRAAT